MLPLIVDAHQDMAFNMLNFGRDYTRSAIETRQLESDGGSTAPEHNGQTMLGWPEYQQGRVAIIFSTLFAVPLRRRQGEWENQFYADASQAQLLYRRQLDAYHRLTDQYPDHFRLVTTKEDLGSVLDHWENSQIKDHPVGLVPLMEGAEGVRSMEELDEWWQQGLRIIGPAWAGNRFCGGTNEPGPLTSEGQQLLASMADIGFTLDLSHMDELSARQSLDLYPGAIIVSHANAAALLPGYDGNRLIKDEIIKAVIERGGVIGVIPFCKFLDKDWRFGDSHENITLETLAAHVDRICQLAGDALHAGLGSDFDGGFGLSAAPAGVETIADLQKLGTCLAAKGYNDEQIASVLGQNWLRQLRSTLP